MVEPSQGEPKIVHGDQVMGDKIGGDKVAGTKIVQIVTHVPLWVWIVVAAAILVPLGVWLLPKVWPQAPPFAPAAEGEVLIVVARFEDHSEEQRSGIDPAQRIVDEMKRTVAGQDSRIVVRLYPEPLSAEAAVALGREYRATLVLHGWYDKMGIRWAIEMIQSEGAKSYDGPELDILADERFSLCVRQLPAHSSFLTLFTLGQAHFLAPGGRSSEDALKFFTRAIDAAPQATDCVAEGGAAPAVGLSWAYYYRSGVYYYRQDYKRARVDAEKAVEIDPKYELAYRGLSTIYHRLREFDLAIQTCDAALALPLDQESRAGFLQRRGSYYGITRRFEPALADLDAGLALQAFDWGHAYRCMVYRNLGELDLALTDCNRALELDGEYVWAYLQRGLLYEVRGEIERAIQDYQTVIGYDSVNRATALERLAAIHDEMGAYAQAVEYLDQLLEIQIKAQHYNNRGWAYAQLGQYARAIDEYTRAIEVDAAYGRAYNNRGLAYGQSGEYDLAFQDFEASIALNSRDAWAYYHRGLVWLEVGDTAKAAADFKIALEMDDPALDAAARQDVEAWLAEIE